MSDEISAVNYREHLPSTGESQPGCLPQRLPFTEPKLKFIEPKLTRRGDLSRVTAQSQFGEFSP